MNGNAINMHFEFADFPEDARRVAERLMTDYRSSAGVLAA